MCKEEHTNAEIAQQVLSQSAHDIRCLGHLRGCLTGARKELKDHKATCNEEHTNAEIAQQVLSQSAHDIRCLTHLRGCLVKARKENSALTAKIAGLESK